MIFFVFVGFYINLFLVLFYYHFPSFFLLLMRLGLAIAFSDLSGFKIRIKKTLTTLSALFYFLRLHKKQNTFVISIFVNVLF